MSDARAPIVPVWLRAVLWSLAISLAALGISLAIVLSSFWPLISFAGLAIPLLPMGAQRRAPVAVAKSSSAKA